MTAAARISKAHGGLHAFDRKGPLPDQRTGLDIYASIAAREPGEFATSLTPFLIEQLQLAADPTARHFPAGNRRSQSAGLRYDRIFGYGSLGRDLHDELYYALRTARSGSQEMPLTRSKTASQEAAATSQSATSKPTGA